MVSKPPRLLQETTAVADEQSLQECTPFLLEKFEEVFEEVGGVKQRKGMRVTGVYQRADTKNANNRVYPKKVLERELKALTPKLQERTCFGMCDHPEDGKDRIRDICAIHEKIWMENDGVVKGTSLLLDTGPGQIIQEILRKGGVIGISSRGTGSSTSQDWNGETVEMVDENYRFNYNSPFDFVIGQSTPGGVTTSFTEKQKADKSSEGDDMKFDVNKFKEENKEGYEAIQNEVTESLKANEDFRNEVAETLREEFKKELEKRITEEQSKLEEAIRKEFAEEHEVLIAEEVAKRTAQQEAALLAITSILAETGYIPSDLPEGEERTTGLESEVVSDLNGKIEDLNKKLETANKAIEEQKNKDQSKEVKEHIEASIKDYPYAEFVKPALESCKEIKEVDEKLKSEKARVEALLKKTGAEVKPKGSVIPMTEIKGNEEKDKEHQILQRQLAGIR